MVSIVLFIEVKRLLSSKVLTCVLLCIYYEMLFQFNFSLFLFCDRLGTGLCPGDIESLQINNYFTWFRPGVTQWLEIAVYKAKQRVKKAVELDNLTPVVPTVKYSSSAVDTLSIFYQVNQTLFVRFLLSSCFRLL